MSENVKTRARGGSRRGGTSATDAPATDAPVVTEPTPDAPDAVAVPDAVTVPDSAPVSGPETVADGVVVGWADAVPCLALRWGSAPSAAEVRFAPVVWRMLQDRPGRTALQMAADAELDGHIELDPTVLARVLNRYEKAGVVRAVTDGRLSWWSVVDPAEIVAEAHESARASAAAVRGSATVTARTTGGSRSPAGELRGMVEDHLADHPFEDFSPSQVAKVLGRSSGAVANALDRLAEIGVTIQTSAAPRRYQHRPDTDTTSAPGTAGGPDVADGVTDGSAAE